MAVHEFDVIWRLALALGLSSVIGIEREIRQKSAGLRTYALVGVGSALFMLVSEYGFADVIGTTSRSTRRELPPRWCRASASSVEA